MPGRLQIYCLPGIRLGLLVALVAASQLGISGLVLAQDIVPDSVTQGSQTESPTDAQNQLVSYAVIINEFKGFLETYLFDQLAHQPRKGGQDPVLVLFKKIFQ